MVNHREAGVNPVCIPGESEECVARATTLALWYASSVL